MADIFISYAREDREWVEKLAAALVGEGYTVWWDFDLLVGKRYRESIETELSGAKAAIVVWSQHSIQSDFVRDEAEEALQRNILAPILKESVRPPAGFRQLQTADLTTWLGVDLSHGEFRRMMRGVSHLVGRPPRDAAPNVDSAPTPVAPPPAPVVEAKAPDSPVAPVIVPVAPVPVFTPAPVTLHTPVLEDGGPAVGPRTMWHGQPLWVYAVGGVSLVLILLSLVFALMPSKPTATLTPAGAAKPVIPAPVIQAPGPAPTATPDAPPAAPATPPPAPTRGGDGDAPNANGDVGNTHHSSHATPPAPAATPAPSGDGDGSDEGQSRGH